MAAKLSLLILPPVASMRTLNVCSIGRPPPLPRSRNSSLKNRNSYAFTTSNPEAVKVPVSAVRARPPTPRGSASAQLVVGRAASSSSSLTRTKASRERRHQGAVGDMAALPRPLHEARAGPCRQERPQGRLSLHRHRFRPGDDVVARDRPYRSGKSGAALPVCRRSEGSGRGSESRHWRLASPNGPWRPTVGLPSGSGRVARTLDFAVQSETVGHAVGRLSRPRTLPAGADFLVVADADPLRRRSLHSPFGADPE